MNKIKQKKNFDIKVEALVPTILTYRIYAEDEHDALKQIDKKHPISVKPNIAMKRTIKATVFEMGSLMVKLVRNFRV